MFFFFFGLFVNTVYSSGHIPTSSISLNKFRIRLSNAMIYCCRTRAMFFPTPLPKTSTSTIITKYVEGFLLFIIFFLYNLLYLYTMYSTGLKIIHTLKIYFRGISNNVIFMRVNSIYVRWWFFNFFGKNNSAFDRSPLETTESTSSHNQGRRYRHFFFFFCRGRGRVQCMCNMSTEFLNFSTKKKKRKENVIKFFSLTADSDNIEIQICRLKLMVIFFFGGGGRYTFFWVFRSFFRSIQICCLRPLNGIQTNSKGPGIEKISIFFFYYQHVTIVILRLLSAYVRTLRRSVLTLYGGFRVRKHVETRRFVSRNPSVAVLEM